MTQHDHLVRWLIDHNANPSIGREELWDSQSTFITKSGHVLCNAAGESTVEIFDLLVERGAPLGLSLALHQAASAPFTDERKRMMTHLIQIYRMDVNELDDPMGPRRKGTPLFYAARSGNVEGAKLLLDHGADLAIQNCWGRTALGEAEQFGQPKVAELLREACKSCVPVNVATLDIGE